MIQEIITLTRLKKCSRALEGSQQNVTQADCEHLISSITNPECHLIIKSQFYDWNEKNSGRQVRRQAPCSASVYNRGSKENEKTKETVPCSRQCFLVRSHIIIQMVMVWLNGHIRPMTPGNSFTRARKAWNFSRQIRIIKYSNRAVGMRNTRKFSRRLVLCLFWFGVLCRGENCRIQFIVYTENPLNLSAEWLRRVIKGPVPN